MSSLRYRANGWDLRFRDRDGRQRTERFAGATSRDPREVAPADVFDLRACRFSHRVP